MKNKKIIYLAKSRGFCAGVIRAVEIVEDLLLSKGSPIYVRHEIVHNSYVVNSFKAQGVKFIENLCDVPCGSDVVFSAHGVSPEVEKKAKELGLNGIDATCPLVKKIHEKSILLKNRGYKILLIGDKSHPELIGTMGHLEGEAIVIENIEDVKLVEIPEECKKITYVTQTTLSPNDVKDIVNLLLMKFPYLEIPKRNDICYATLERQEAIKVLAKKCDIVLVLGSKDSSNSKQLAKVAESLGANTFLIDSFLDIPRDILSLNSNIAITAGASAPEILVTETIDFLIENGWSLKS